MTSLPSIASVCFFSAYGAVFHGRVVQNRTHATRGTPYVVVNYDVSRDGEVASHRAHLHPTYLHQTADEAEKEAAAYRKNPETGHAREMKKMAALPPRRSWTAPTKRIRNRRSLKAF